MRDNSFNPQLELNWFNIWFRPTQIDFQTWLTQLDLRPCQLGSTFGPDRLNSTFDLVDPTRLQLEQPWLDIWTARHNSIFDLRYLNLTFNLSKFGSRFDQGNSAWPSIRPTLLDFWLRPTQLDLWRELTQLGSVFNPRQLGLTQPSTGASWTKPLI